MSGFVPPQRAMSGLVVLLYWSVFMSVVPVATKAKWMSEIYAAAWSHVDVSDPSCIGGPYLGLWSYSWDSVVGLHRGQNM